MLIVQDWYINMLRIIMPFVTHVPLPIGQNTPIGETKLIHVVRDRCVNLLPTCHYQLVTMHAQGQWLTDGAVRDLKSIFLLARVRVESNYEAEPAAGDESFWEIPATESAEHHAQMQKIVCS